MKEILYSLDMAASEGYSSYAPIIMICLLPVVVFGLYKAMPGLIAHFKSVK